MSRPSPTAERATRPTRAALAAMRLRDVAANLEDPNGAPSLGRWARQRRWRMFAELFPDIHELRVLDLGGTASTWLHAPVRPREVVAVNHAPAETADHGWLRVIAGDATALPVDVVGDGFDLVYSNSVIEHVGGHAARAAFADAVRRSAPRYWVQTPYRYFPVEPHWMCPGFQFLPTAAKVYVSQRWPTGYHRAPPDKTLGAVLAVELLDATTMRHHFPEASLVREKVAGLTKSLIAVRSRP